MWQIQEFPKSCYELFGWGFHKDSWLREWEVFLGVIYSIIRPAWRSINGSTKEVVEKIEIQENHLENVDCLKNR